jgi:transcriptional regulator with XRE-family HTH domain
MVRSTFFYERRSYEFTHTAQVLAPLWRAVPAGGSWSGLAGVPRLRKPEPPRPPENPECVQMPRPRPASAAGARILALRLERSWLQKDLASRAQVTQRCVSLLERGEVRHPRLETRQRLAKAFGLTRATIFSDFETELARREASLDIVEAAAYLGIAHDTLRWAAEHKRVSYGRDGHRWEFDREALDEARDTYPCPVDGCDRVALGSSGGCEAHGHALLDKGKKRPPEVGRAIAKTKRENPRPRSDAKERADRLHRERRERMDEELAIGELSLSGAAESLGITSHAVSELVARGELTPTRHVEHEIGRPAPIFMESTIKARKRKVALAADLASPSAWGGAVPLDPDRQVELARADGRLQRSRTTSAPRRSPSASSMSGRKRSDAAT